MWTTALEDLRDLINDDSDDHERWRKRCVGQVDGVNLAFKTWESNRLTDFTAPPAGLGVFVDNTSVTAATDDQELGQFTLSVAPTAGSIVEASYYYQWFDDDDLNGFLRLSMNWLNLGDDFSKLEQGLRPAALHYAGQQALHKQAQYFAENVSDVFLMQEGPKEESVGIMNHYRQMASDFEKKANQLRDSFYSGAGSENKPINVSIPGRVRKVVPNR